MVTGWEGRLIRLVPLDIDRHLENAIKWVNDPEVTQWLVIGDFPITRLAEREWFETKMKQTTSEVAFAIETLGGKHIGFSGIFNVEWRHGTAHTGTMIGDREEWGKGFGTDAAITRNRYAFEVMGLRMLFSGVLEGNDRSYRMLTNAGYRDCGRWPKMLWKRGRYVDHLLMYLDRDEWNTRSSQVEA